nr:nitrogenase (molybdenum-iron) subunit alpha [Raoultella sp. NCTC 9187]
MGVPFRQMHSWDYSGPYHGYDGFAIFCPRYGYDPKQPGVERTDRPVAEVCVIAHLLSR